MSWWRRRVDEDGPFLVLLALACIPAIRPFLVPGYFWNAHDARHDVYFIFEYMRGLQDGQLYPRWLPDMTFGFGYPLFNIYAPLAVQLGVLFHLLGLGFTQAVEAVFVVGILGSALAMYGFLRGLVGPRGALVAAVAYVYMPYHLFDMYQRAAMAESVSFVWMPLVLWGLRALAERPTWPRVVGLAVSYAGLMLTSNLVAVVFTPVALGYGLLLLAYHARRHGILEAGGKAIAMGGGALAGLGLSAWFWVPALLEFKYVNQDQWYGGYYDFRQHFVYFFQLFSPHWGFGVSVPGPDDRISYQIGLVPYFLAVGGLWSLRRRDTRWWLTGVYMVIVAVMSAFLTTGASVFLWEHVPGVAFAQFPWRYLMLTTLAVATVASLIALETPTDKPVSPRLTGWWPLLLVALLVWGSASYLYVQVNEPLPEQGPPGLPALMRFQASEDEMTGVTVFAKAIPRWSGIAEIMARGQDVRTRVDYAQVPEDGSLRVRSLRYRGHEETVWVDARRPGLRLVFNIQMYPGWTAYIYDETGTHLRQVLPWDALEITDPYGKITVPLPEGRHIVVLRFEETPPRRAGRLMALVTVAVLVLGTAWAHARRR